MPAFHLGQLPEIGLKDLLDARDRLDGAMLKSVLARHPSGLSYLASPHEVMPLDALTPEQVDPVIALLRREFQTVLVDLPTDWALWSLSTLAEADQVLLVSELSIASLHQAKRQLDFLRQQDLGQLPISVVMNKVSKGLFKTVDFRGRRPHPRPRGRLHHRRRRPGGALVARPGRADPPAASAQPDRARPRRARGGARGQPAVAH